MDTEFMAKFTTAPAGMKNHHAYQGGLLEHDGARSRWNSAPAVTLSACFIKEQRPRADPGR